MIHPPAPNEFLKIISTWADGTRPTASTGVAVTASQNAFGSWVQLNAALSDRASAIWINLMAANTSGQAKDLLVTIGIDPAGGSSYVDFIQYLSASSASSKGGSSAGFTGGGHSYYFPVAVPAGATLGAKAMCNNVTPGSLRVQSKLFCRPTHPEQVWSGSFVETFGATPASSSGTVVTAGTTSEGAWTELGTATRLMRYLEYGVAFNDAAMSNNSFHMDIGVGDATNKRKLIEDAYAETNTVEATIKYASGGYGTIAIGEKIYGRAQVGTSSAGVGFSMLAYGVG